MRAPIVSFDPDLTVERPARSSRVSCSRKVLLLGFPAGQAEEKEVEEANEALERAHPKR